MPAPWPGATFITVTYGPNYYQRGIESGEVRVGMEKIAVEQKSSHYTEFSSQVAYLIARLFLLSGSCSMAVLPVDYLHKIYAGVLGKLIGVYLGRPFENWTYQEILDKLGPIHDYVHERLGLPLVVIDDDVSGTFAFVRALEEHGASPNLTPEDVGNTWLNTVIEKKTIFWWGGNGISTEHTAFLNLKKGMKPPLSGSIESNGKTMAEQIGAQIFIDGWAMVAPGNPALAARLAQTAALVSHDGVAVHAAILWAAMEAEAFVSKDADHLLDTGLSFIPKDSLITQLIADIRAWAKKDNDWEKTRQRIEDTYGYDKYGGICHMVPNHGIMIMALIYGGDNFSHAMHIINTCGWDTDCNSGNVGCLVAIMHGLSAFEKQPDWRTPLADRAIISSADGGYSINDAVRITYDLANIAKKLAGEGPLALPKDGAQFHFSLPGSVQGFQSVSSPDTASVNHGQNHGVEALQIRVEGLKDSMDAIQVLTQTFTPRDILKVKRDYEMMASPLIYPGQKISAVVCAGNQNSGSANVRLRLKAYDYDDTLITCDSDSIQLDSGATNKLEWTIPLILENKPIQQVGLSITPTSSAPLSGTIFLHSLGWSGTPCMALTRPITGSAEFWHRAWISSVDKIHAKMGPSFYIAHDRGEGLLYQGTRDWTDYAVTVSGFCVNLGGPSGVLIRAQGLNRWYAAVLTMDEEGVRRIAIVKARDGRRTELTSTKFDWNVDVKYEIQVSVNGHEIVAKIGGVELKVRDEEFKGGAMGLIVTDGSLSADCIELGPI